MDLSSNTILITGGSNGIGFSLAERFLNTGNTVIICGRRESKLNEVKNKYPKIHTFKCDTGNEAERPELFSKVINQFPSLNVLINNAGIQRRVDLTNEKDWKKTEEEILINFNAYIHLSILFVPHLLKQTNPVIMNVSSGLAFVPMASAPVYCATKAGVHSFTMSLRYQLSKTPIKVIEIIPPAVDTDLGGAGLHKFGTPLNEFADDVISKLKKGDNEIAYGFAQSSSNASREELEAIFKRMNG
jgi:uncharacterized oxidoreductase